jgi:hypothetical protein
VDRGVTIIEEAGSAGDWRVEKEDQSGSNEIAVFSGSKARERATRYALHQYGVTCDDEQTARGLDRPVVPAPRGAFVLVNDGLHQWVAQASTLFEAMKRIGWRREEDHWYAPENFPARAYIELRAAVPELPGFPKPRDKRFSTNYDNPPPAHELTLRPELGPNVWVLE